MEVGNIPATPLTLAAGSWALVVSEYAFVASALQEEKSKRTAIILNIVFATVAKTWPMTWARVVMR